MSLEVGSGGGKLHHMGQIIRNYYEPSRCHILFPPQWTYVNRTYLMKTILSLNIDTAA